MNNRKYLFIGILGMLLVVAAAFSIHPGLKPGKAQSTPAYKVLLDGETWFYVLDRTELTGILENYKQQYTANIDESVCTIKTIGFKQNIDIVEVSDYGGKPYSLREAREAVYSNADESFMIEVNKGDNLWTISRRHGLSVDEVLKLNPGLTENALLHPGDKICVRGEKPMLDVVIVYETTVVEDVPFTTEFIDDSSMYKSQRKVQSPGVVGKEENTYEITVENSVEVERRTVQSQTISAPVPAKVRVGTKKAVSRSGSSFGVVSGGRVTSNFGTRIHPVTKKSTFHSGVDIGAPRGNPVYAYSSGKVTYAGWASGYGNFIAISHGNGMVTRYGHLSAINVKVGQQVAVRQKIGAVGSTGVSTGPHLHFEVLINGSFKNPLNYL